MAHALPYMLDNPAGTRWYYRDQPAPGAVVAYMHENYIDIVDRVTLTQVWLVSGRALWRPYLITRMMRWSIDTLTSALIRYRRARIVREHTRSTLASNDAFA